MKKILLVFFFLLTVLRCGSDNNSGCPDRTCDDYTTQAQAQAAYDADPDCLGELDHDNDGVVCEHLSTGGGGSGGGTSGCPTTSNCGCSGKNKNQCGGPCCQWIVGTGCKCK